MSGLTVQDFADFFRAIWGNAPYPWQMALLKRVVSSGWPMAVALPTGSGKTAALDIALFHMALEPTAPRRVVYVVNRRLVVDQAEERAHKLGERLKEALEKGATDRVLYKVAESLQRLGGECPLRVVKLRGGMPLDRHVVDDPAAPTIILSTVDQAGSRLLFRGYGLRPQAWPVEAGLFGMDALYLLDEAHLERPFFETLKAVARMAEKDGRKIGRPSPRIVALTATLATLELPAEEIFEATEDDHRHPGLRRIWSTRKPLRTVRVRSGSRKDADPLIRRLIAEAVKLRQELGRPILVVCNTVARARAVHCALSEEGTSLLLIGRVRPYDRERIAGNSAVIQRMIDEGELDFLVSTQALEVGADLDLGGLVTEHAPLDALLQRLGRVGRRGRWREAPVVVIYAPKCSPWPYDKTILENAWEWLQGVDDLGTDSIRGALHRERDEELWHRGATPVPLTETVVQLLAMTDPSPGPAPAPEPYLHGMKAVLPTVNLIWRGDLPADEEELRRWQREGILSDLLSLAPPRSHELLEIPLYIARDWLAGAAPEASDLEGAEEGPREGTLREGRVAIRWDGEEAVLVAPSEIRPGDTLVLPAAYGGLDGFGWSPDSGVPVEDVAELGPDPWFLRLHPGSPLWGELPGEGLSSEEETEAGASLGQPEEAAEALIGRLLPREGIPQEERLRKNSLVVKGFLEKLGVSLERGEINDRWLKRFLGRLAISLPEGHPWRRTLEVFATHPRTLYWDLPPGYPGLILRRRGEALSVGGREPRSLRDHSLEVERKVRDFSTRLGLDRGLTEALASAARRHDLGKLDERFQLWLMFSAPPDVEVEAPLAKSGTRLTGRALAEARERAEYPKGLRHEHQGTAALMQSGANPLEVYLVGTHHGHGRPLPKTSPDRLGYRTPVGPPWLAPGNAEIRGDHGLDRLDSGWLKLCIDLQREYGYWGLAFLEALLRLADQAAS